MRHWSDGRSRGRVAAVGAAALVAASAALVAATVAHAARVDLTPPRAVVQPRFVVPALSPGGAPFDQPVTMVAAEGLDSSLAAQDLCTRLVQAPALQTYNLTEVGQFCIPSLSRLISLKRGDEMLIKPSTRRALIDLHDKLGQIEGVDTNAFSPHIGEQKNKLMLVDRIMSDYPAMKQVCIAGFNAGHSAAAFLSNRNDIEVSAFDPGTAPYVIPGHDVLDATFPDRLTVYLGDLPITIPRFTMLNEDYACDVIYVDGRLPADVFRMALLDLRVAAKQDEHIIMIDLPPPSPDDPQTQLQQQLQSLENFGVLKMVGAVKEPSFDSTTPAFTNEMLYGKYTWSS